MNTNDVSDGAELEVAASPPLVLPTDAGRAAAADRLVALPRV